MAGAVAGLVLAGCGSDLGVMARDVGVSADAIVRLDDMVAVAARRTGSTVEVVAFQAVAEGGWEVQVIASGPADDVNAHLVTSAGQTGDEWNSYLYGTAPGSASRVVVDGIKAAGGQVTDGVWVLAFRQKDLHPDQLSWDALDATGVILHSGTGITP